MVDDRIEEKKNLNVRAHTIRVNKVKVKGADTDWKGTLACTHVHMHTTGLQEELSTSQRRECQEFNLICVFIITHGTFSATNVNEMYLQTPTSTAKPRRRRVRVRIAGCVHCAVVGGVCAMFSHKNHIKVKRKDV